METDFLSVEVSQQPLTAKIRPSINHPFDPTAYEIPHYWTVRNELLPFQVPTFPKKKIFYTIHTQFTPPNVKRRFLFVTPQKYLNNFLKILYNIEKRVSNIQDITIFSA